MSIAADLSWSWIDPATLASIDVSDLLVYCGPAMPPDSYIQGVLGAGISITFIDEDVVDPYNTPDPYGAGYQRARAAEAKLAGYYPDACSIVYVLSDQNYATPGPNDPRVIAHAQGIDAGTTRPAWMGYGNRYAIDAARGASPKMRYSWVPRTWNCDGSDTLIQEIGSPVEGLDVDTIQSAEWGQWHPGGTPPPVAKGNPPMIVLVTDGPNMGLWAFSGTAFVKFSSVNIGVTVPGGPISMSGAAFGEFFQSVQAEAQRITPGGGGGSCPTKITLAGKQTLSRKIALTGDLHA